VLLTILLSGLCLFQSQADVQLHWPDKHGPTFDGHVPLDSAAKVVLNWSETKNITWKVAFQGLGHSTPIILGDQIWFTSATLDGKEQYVYCLDRKSGAIVHNLTLYKNEAPEELGNTLNTYATPSCVAEPDAIYVHFGTYGTAKLDPKTANVIWERTDLQVRHFRGPASSPVLYKDTLILTFDAIDQQFLMALDKKTGKTLWKTTRSVDYQDLENGVPKREGDYRKAFGTPSLALVDGKTQLLSVGSRAAYGYDADTGKELWIIEHSNYNAAVKPLYIPDYHMAILNTGSSKAVLQGVHLDKNTQGNITHTQIKWSQRNASSYCMPIYYKGYLYQLVHNGKLSCIDIKTGENTWEEALRKSFMASPILIGENILVVDLEGNTTIFKADPKAFTLVAENKLDEPIASNPAVADGELYLRGKEHLYKISK